MTNYHMAALADLKRAIVNDNTIDLALIDSLFESAMQTREQMIDFLYQEVLTREMLASDDSVKGFDLFKGQKETRVNYKDGRRIDVIINLVSAGIIPIEMKCFKKNIYLSDGKTIISVLYTLVIRHK